MFALSKFFKTRELGIASKLDEITLFDGSKACIFGTANGAIVTGNREFIHLGVATHNDPLHKLLHPHNSAFPVFTHYERNSSRKDREKQNDQPNNGKDEYIEFMFKSHRSDINQKIVPNH
jgi:hypothetical protein